MHDHGVRSDGDIAVCEHQPTGLRVTDVAEPDDSVDRAQPIQLHWARVGTLAIVGVTDWSIRSITAAPPARRTPGPETWPPLLPPCGCRAEEHDGIRLDHRPVEHPRLTRPHPTDGIGIDAIVQQPDADVRGGLPCAGDYVLGGSPTKLDQFVGGYDAHPVCNAERCRCCRRYPRRQVVGVDNARLPSHLVTLSDRRDTNWPSPR